MGAVREGAVAPFKGGGSTTSWILRRLPSIKKYPSIRSATCLRADSGHGTAALQTRRLAGPMAGEFSAFRIIA